MKTKQASGPRIQISVIEYNGKVRGKQKSLSVYDVSHDNVYGKLQEFIEAETGGTASPTRVADTHQKKVLADKILRRLLERLLARRLTVLPDTGTLMQQALESLDFKKPRVLARDLLDILEEEL